MAVPSSTTPLTVDSQKNFGAVGDPEAQQVEKLKASITAITKIPAYVSEKIKVLILASIIGAVTIHSCNLKTNGYDKNTNPGVANINSFVQTLLVGGMLRSSVPMCFVISGLLFFVHRADDAPCFQCSRRIYARFKSLGMPYVIWNIVAFLQLYALMRVPGAVDWYPEHRFIQPSAHTLLWDMWMDPAAGQLWYLRDLLALVLLTPLLYRLFKMHHLLMMVVPLLVVVPWLIDRQLFTGWCIGGFCPNLQILRPDAIVFFAAGCYLALRGVDLEHRIPALQLASLALVWILVLLVKVALILSTGEKSRPELIQIFSVQRVGEVLGVATIWFGYDAIHPLVSAKQVWPWVLWLANYSMWIYCFHFPMLCIAAKLGTQVLLAHEAGPLSFLLFFFLTPWVGVAFSMAAGLPLSRCCPGLFGLLTGGRGG